MAGVHAVRRLLAVLLWTCLGLQVVGIVLGPVMSAGTVLIPQFARLGGTFLLVLYAALNWRVLQPPGRSYAGWLALGMVFGHLGDLAMGKVLPSPDPWLAGMVLFGLGHVFYSGGFLRLARPSVPVMASSLLAAVGLWLFLVSGTDQPALMVHGALAYALIICAMTGLAASVALRDRRLRPLLAGAVLFLLSDIMLGDSAFRSSHGTLWNDLIWVIYISGQALIVTSPGRLAMASPEQQTSAA